jgi:hypothetical protein
VRVEETRTYGVAFDTKRYPGYVHVVKVTVSEDVMVDTETVDVGLADDKCYRQLQQYVKGNPR